jgi:hypothetical protein
MLVPAPTRAAQQSCYSLKRTKGVKARDSNERRVMHPIGTPPPTSPVLLPERVTPCRRQLIADITWQASIVVLGK